MQDNRFARALAFVAVAAFVLLLGPYCDIVSSARAEAPSNASHHATDAQDHGKSSPADLCPSLDHTPAVPPDAVSSPLVNATPAFPPVGAPGLVVRIPNSRGRITPRATPPPGQRVPLYLRYAHLLT
ncbi:MAG TPA: hypothetical protein VGA88_07020 [Burkholderiales bacterium]